MPLEGDAERRAGVDGDGENAPVIDEPRDSMESRDRGRARDPRSGLGLDAGGGLAGVEAEAS